jgi:hypothetical protein
MTTRNPILHTNLPNDQEFDIHVDWPCQPWREMRDQRWQLINFMNGKVNPKFSRLDLLMKKATIRKVPSFVAKKKISIQLWLVGLLEAYPDMFLPLQEDFISMLGSQRDNWNVRMRIEKDKKGSFNFIILLQISNKILSNPHELENFFQQADEKYK